MVSFGVQKLLSLIRFHLLIFVSIFITLGGGSKKILSPLISKNCTVYIKAQKTTSQQINLKKEKMDLAESDSLTSEPQPSRRYSPGTETERQTHGTC